MSNFLSGENKLFFLGDKNKIVFFFCVSREKKGLKTTVGKKSRF